MPSTITHAYFAMDVYDRLPIKRREFLLGYKERMKLSGQSMDPLFFYNITNFKRGKKLREFGEYFHNHNTYQFFEVLIHFIKQNHYENDPDIIAYLYGVLCHYVLDSTTHPYIIYKAGVYEKEKKETRKYNHLHGELETLIDNYFVQERCHIKPWKFDCIHFCFQLSPLSKNLKEVIDYTFHETFGIEHMSTYYEKATHQMKFFFQVFRRDYYGIKKLGYTVIDFISPRILLRKKVLSYHFAVKNKSYLFNLNHDKWYNPTTKKISSTESFLDLYLKSLNEVTHIIQEVDAYLYKNKKISLKKVIKNNSYITGIDCSLERELKYFEF